MDLLKLKFPPAFIYFVLSLQAILYGVHFGSTKDAIAIVIYFWPFHILINIMKDKDS